jgi:lipopolysaccharide/colanic/teichoic acid biosynthesis glycosyltransferase
VLEKISHTSQTSRSDAGQPTLWGLTTVEIHDRFWATQGVHVVRQGRDDALAQDAVHFLLLSPGSLVIFDPRELERLSGRRRHKLLLVRLRATRADTYREIAVADDDGRFVAFRRLYEGSDAFASRFALTSDAATARLWSAAPDAAAGWRRIGVTVSSVPSVSMAGHCAREGSDRAAFLRELMSWCDRPDCLTESATKVNGSAWADASGRIDRSVRFFGPAWIGAGRTIESETDVLGPAVLWDDPLCRPRRSPFVWTDRKSLAEERSVKTKPIGPPGKRAFDVVVALLGLVITLPLYPFILLAIWLEDGRPFFFRQRRETVGGREFRLVKFRTMERDAEAKKAALMARSEVDGPQFFMQDDPRLTRVGKVLRKYKVDELPQFFHVVRGEMSLVGPRPSPFRENQFCPAWREARLGVRPGITGLWQVMRTRRPTHDFQEWIRYDVQYADEISWRLDLRILAKTVGRILRGG